MNSSRIGWSLHLRTVQKASYTEYHVCGDLTASGSGFLTGNSPSYDNVIIIENGSLKFAIDANISAVRTAIILTGNNNVASAIDFPQGNGQSATLTASPTTNADNPWKGIAIY